MLQAQNRAVATQQSNSLSFGVWRVTSVFSGGRVVEKKCGVSICFTAVHSGLTRFYVLYLFPSGVF